ncbi:MAG: hypothetical protein LBJ59_12815 [Zoogloeaceae bacterium]|nr:hypothetical protein [Zoogloeaceae bacterium]
MRAVAVAMATGLAALGAFPLYAAEDANALETLRAENIQLRLENEQLRQQAAQQPATDIAKDTA